MTKARSKYNICLWCRRPVENTTRGSERLYHFACREEKRKHNQNIARNRPERRKERNRKERERKRKRRADPNERRRDNDKKSAREREQREKARLYDQLNAKLKILGLKVDDLELEMSTEFAEVGRRLRALEAEQPGGKGIGL